MDDECIHGLDPAWCSVCLHPQAERCAAPAYGAIFRAHYDGECCECHFSIVRGDLIRVVSGPVTNRYAHLSCAQGAPS